MDESISETWEEEDVEAPITIKAGDLSALFSAAYKCLERENWKRATVYFQRCADDAKRKKEICSRVILATQSGTNERWKAMKEQFQEFHRKHYVAHLKASQAFATMGAFEHAMREADLAVGISRNIIALSWRGVVLLLLALYDEAADSFEKALDPELQDSKVTVEEVEHFAALRERCLRLNTNSYSHLTDYFLSGLFSPAPMSAEFVGSVEIRHFGSLGRGLVLSSGANTVEVGQILVVSNCLVGYRSQISFGADDRSLSAQSEEVLSKLVEKLYVKTSDSRGRRAQVEWLDYEGSNPEYLDKPLTTEVFSGPRYRWLQQEELHVEQKIGNMTFEQNSYHLSRLRKNWMLNKVIVNTRKEDGSEGEIYEIKDYGLWLLPSFINHSCAPNCNRVWVGEALFIIASKTIQPGEQLTIAYFDVMQTLDVRQSQSKLDFGFICRCPRCQFEMDLGPSYAEVERVLVNSQSMLSHLLKANEGCLDMISEIPSEMKEQLNLMASQFNAEVLELGVAPDYNNKTWVERYMWVSASTMDAMLAHRVVASKESEWTVQDELDCLSFLAFMSTYVAAGSDLNLELYFRLVKRTDDSFGKDSTESGVCLQRALPAYRAAYGLQKDSDMLSLIRQRENMEVMEQFCDNDCSEGMYWYRVKTLNSQLLKSSDPLSAELASIKVRYADEYLDLVNRSERHLDLVDRREEAALSALMRAAVQGCLKDVKCSEMHSVS